MESVSSTPTLAREEPIGPMEYGITYIVLPFITPSYMGVSIAFISLGSIQLLVGPASFFSRQQMKVLSSTLATSLGSVL